MLIISINFFAMLDRYDDYFVQSFINTINNAKIANSQTPMPLQAVSEWLTKANRICD